MAMYWANTVKPEMAIPWEVVELKGYDPRNEQGLKLETEYNVPTSVRHLSEMKMCPELTRTGKCKNLRIKSLRGNKMITKRKFIPKMNDNIFDSNPYLSRLKKKGGLVKLDGGTGINVPLNYAVTTASGWYAGADTLDTTDNQNITAAEYTWKQHYANISISRDEELKNKGDSQVLDLVQSKIQIAEKTMGDNLGTALYNAGTDSKAIGGLRLIVATGSTVGGISQTTNSWWQSNVDTTTTTLGISALQTQYEAAKIENDAPSVCFTTRTLFTAYYSLLQPQQRFQDSETAKGGSSGPEALGYN